MAKNTSKQPKPKYDHHGVRTDYKPSVSRDESRQRDLDASWRIIEAGREGASLKSRGLNLTRAKGFAEIVGVFEWTLDDAAFDLVAKDDLCTPLDGTYDHGEFSIAGRLERLRNFREAADLCMWLRKNEEQVYKLMQGHAFDDIHMAAKNERERDESSK